MSYDPTDTRKALARESLDRALELAPDLPLVALAAGYYHYHGFKRYGKALAAFARAERGLPSNAQIIMARAFILRRQGK